MEKKYWKSPEKWESCSKGHTKDIRRRDGLGASDLNYTTPVQRTSHEASRLNDITSGRMTGHQLVIMCNLYVFRLQDIEGSADRVRTGEGRADHHTNDRSPASNNV